MGCRGYVFIALLLLAVPLAAQDREFRLQWLSAMQRVPATDTAALQMPVADEDRSWLEDLLTPAQEEKSAGEKLLFLAAACMGFAFFDYVVFNSVRTDKKAVRVYRIAQGLTQAAITYYLYKEVSASTAIGFNLVWWTFGTDFIYYGYSELINAAEPWENRGDFQRKIMGNCTTWAFWTPIGIARGMKRNKPIAGDTLIAQALVGAALAVTVTVTF